MSEEIDKPGFNTDDDASLVKEFLSADKSEPAFNRLVVKYKNNVFNLCYRFMGNYEEADDCAQETFLKVYRSLKNFRFGCLAPASTAFPGRCRGMPIFPFWPGLRLSFFSFR